jgi:hypothetical protein
MAELPSVGGAEREEASGLRKLPIEASAPLRLRAAGRGRADSTLERRPLRESARGRESNVSCVSGKFSFRESANGDSSVTTVSLLPSRTISFLRELRSQRATRRCSLNMPRVLTGLRRPNIFRTKSLIPKKKAMSSETAYPYLTNGIESLR